MCGTPSTAHALLSRGTGKKRDLDDGVKDPVELPSSYFPLVVLQEKQNPFDVNILRIPFLLYGDSRGCIFLMVAYFALIASWKRI